MKSTTVSREVSIIATIGFTARASLLQVIRVHSSAICRGESAGFHASRPNAYQLAWSKLVAVQARLLPTFDTPAIDATPLLTGLPQRGAHVSDSSTSVHIGARKTAPSLWPRYSRVSCTSNPTLVCCICPNSG